MGKKSKGKDKGKGKARKKDRKKALRLAATAATTESAVSEPEPADLGRLDLEVGLRIEHFCWETFLTTNLTN